MKPVFQISMLALTMLLLTACGSASMPVPQATQSESQSVTQAIKYHGLDTKINVEEIDVVLNAISSGDSQALISLFSYTGTACKTVNALGGPPACRAGEAEGTSVDVLPFLGSEGSFIRKDEINSFPGLNVIGLYAVYQTSATAYSDANYPAGDYGIMLVAEEYRPGVVVQVKNGKIVRIDYLLKARSFDETLRRDAANVILEPPK